jgi:Protein of unknown function DUF262
MKRRPTNQDLTWFLDQKDNNQLDLTPSYQRRSVWTRKDRLYFIDTVFNSYPCPAIFLHKTLDEQGRATYHVVDGKQRLETIFSFVDNKISLAKDNPNSDLAGKKFRDLDSEYKQKFWDYIFTVEMLDNVEQSLIDEVFERLNRNSRKLERQELRHAKFDGWLINFLEQESESSIWKDLGIATASRAKRMKDVQFLSELALVISSKDAVNSFDQDQLDEFYANYDNPDEDLPDFNEEDFKNSFWKLRDFIASMESHNSCVSEYAKSFMHFYTLWSVVNANIAKLQSPQDTAEKYSEFMQKYQTYREDIQSITDQSLQTYIEHSVGANTEYSHRLSRHNALEEFLFQ